jgi:predicted nuclease of predicted toxin-antitoxin system
MRFLANENFPGAAVAALAGRGHDIVWARIAAPGTSDADVLAWAVREQRILITFDKDFGELAGTSALPAGYVWRRAISAVECDRSGSGGRTRGKALSFLRDG